MRDVRGLVGVIRRVGGLEVHARVVELDAAVIRRVGGLEDPRRAGVHVFDVIRRVGGLEVYL